MTTDEKEGCEILARFHGWIKKPDNAPEYQRLWHFQEWGKYAYKPEQMHYHDKIEWLWPCWVKFRGLHFIKESHIVAFELHELAIREKLWRGDVPEIFRALVDGVKWFNSIKEETK